MTLPGIDISDYQATTPSLAGLAFCIAKASEGMSAARTYAMHVANTRKAGIVTGAYHFGRADSTGTPAQQAAFFLRTAGDVDMYALDVEGTSYKRPDGSVVTVPRFTLAQSQAFIAAVHAAGKKIGMYGSLSGFEHAGQDWDWVAFYNPTPPPISYDIWQYGPRRIGGVSIDGNTFNGDAAALARLVGATTGGTNQPGETDMALATDRTPRVIDVAAGAALFETDGKTVITHATRAYIAVDSPHGLGGALRSFWISYSTVGGAGEWKLVMAVPSKIWPDATPAPAPAPDCTAAVKAATDPLLARITAAEAALQG